MIIKQPSIVLKTVDFRESSCIATLLTRDHGKNAIMVRGLRKQGSKYSGLFQPGSLLEVVYYDKENRSVQNLKEASLRQATYHIQEQIEKMALATATIEIVDQLAQEREPAVTLYEFLSKLLKWLHETEQNPAHLFPYVQMRLAEIMGIGLQPAESQQPDNGYQSFLCVEEGEISLQSKNGLCLKLKPAQTLYINLVLQNKQRELLQRSFPRDEIRILIHHLDVYLKHHLEGIRDRKSDHIFNQIL